MKDTTIALLIIVIVTLVVLAVFGVPLVNWIKNQLNRANSNLDMCLNAAPDDPCTGKKPNAVVSDPNGFCTSMRCIADDKLRCTAVCDG